MPNPTDPQDLNRYTYAGNNPLKYTDPTGHFKIKFTKFFKRAFGNVGTTLLGAAVGAFTNCWTCAMAIMSQSESGRYVSTSVIVAAAAVGTAFCVGTCAPATGMLIGSVVGSAFGGYSAAQNGGDLSSGIFFGATVGAVTGAIQGGAWTVPYGNGWFTPQTAAAFGSRIGAGALAGGGSGATTGFAGGAGNWNTIAAGAWRGAAAGAGLAAVLAGAQYYVQVQGVPSAAISRYTPKHLINDVLSINGVPGLTIAVGSGIEAMNGALSKSVLNLIRQGVNCTYDSNGLGCKSGSGTEEKPPEETSKHGLSGL